MANTYALAGSPLGLLNVRSRPDRTGRSTFNGGRSRNIEVFLYNRGARQSTGVEVGGKEARAPVSLMSGGSLPNFWPNADIGKLGAESGDELGLPKFDEATGKNIPAPAFKAAKGTGISSDYHNDSSYDYTVLNIIEKLSKSPAAALRPQDFAYCKFLGVYPNNRLMIARRFLSPTKDNIFRKQTGKDQVKGGPGPKAILISWRPENEDFFEFSFGEEWMEADADFTTVLNKLGKDFGIDNAGGGLSKALNLIPLPGFTEGLQRAVLEKLGVLEGGKMLPSGNPNIIKQAKRRKTIGYGEAGAGLKCTISIKMDCEYEQKFISGIDPTTAWQDILNNILIFGTSNSSNYGLTGKFTQNLNRWVTNPGTLVLDVIAGLKAGFDKIKGEISKAGKKALKTLNDAITGERPEIPEPERIKRNQDRIKKAEGQINKFITSITNSIKQSVSKYKIEIMGIAHALSGAASAPWHITIGNPLRPFFTAGDMLAGDVTVKFGPVLAFNDLPSSIKVSFTMTNARPLGMQEILAKFNAGHLRTVNIKKDFLEIQTEFTQEELEGTNKLSEAQKEARIADDLTSGGKIGQYFDGLFDDTGEVLGGETTQQNLGTSPSTANSNTGPGSQFESNSLPMGSQTGSQAVDVIVLTPPAGDPTGTPSVSVEKKTLKDNGDAVASIVPAGVEVTGLDLSSSLFSGSAFNLPNP